VLARLIDLVAWAKTCLLITAATSPGSPEREREMPKLREALIGPRHLTAGILAKRQEIPDALLVELRVCELAISRLEAGAVLRQTPQRGDVP
jgi:hypothetical protein